jgi:Mn-dependent DtxR family transcriptional regulator
MSSGDDETEAHARTSDPVTSHMAASRIARSNMQERVYQFLYVRWPAAFASIEIARGIGAHPWSVSPRTAPLERQGWIERAGKRKVVNTTGKLANMVIWRAFKI